MPSINFVPAVTIPRVPNVVIPKATIPNTPHITNTLPPVFEMSCTTIRRDGTKNSQLFIDDPAGNSYICALPFYEPLEYNKKDIILIEDAKPPTNNQPEIPETESPKVDKKPKQEFKGDEFTEELLSDHVGGKGGLQSIVKKITAREKGS